MKKVSKYNTTLRINSDFGVCYNAMSDRFVVLKSQAYDELCKGDIADFAKKYPEPYKQLLDVSAIVDSDVDEARQVRDMIDRVDNDESTFHLHVNPTVDCNFRCWYCYEKHVKGSRMQPDMVEKVKTLMEKTIASHRQLKSFVLSFFGGEPLMYFNAVVKPLMEHLYALCDRQALCPSVSFTTNGYLLNEKMVDFFDGKDVSFQITLDGDRERHDKTRFMPTGKGSFDRIVSNIKLLARHGHSIIMRINYTADNIC